MDATERGLGQHAGHLKPTAIFTAEDEQVDREEPRIPEGVCRVRNREGH